MKSGLAEGIIFSPHISVPWVVWGHSRSLSDWVCDTRLRGGNMPAGETNVHGKNLPRAMLAIALMAGIDFIALPVIWLGVLGPTALGNQKPSPGPRPNLRGGLWQRGQGCSNLVCSIQHVPWNPPTVCMRRSHPGSAYRGCVMVRQPSGDFTERSR